MTDSELSAAAFRGLYQRLRDQAQWGPDDRRGAESSSRAEAERHQVLFVLFVADSVGTVGPLPHRSRSWSVSHDWDAGVRQKSPMTTQCVVSARPLRTRGENCRCCY